MRTAEWVAAAAFGFALGVAAFAIMDARAQSQKPPTVDLPPMDAVGCTTVDSFPWMADTSKTMRTQWCGR